MQKLVVNYVIRWVPGVVSFDEDGWPWAITLVGESRTMPRSLPPPDAIVALNARLNNDWADGCKVPAVLSRRLLRCRIAIITDTARIDALPSSFSTDGGSSPVDALRGWSWLHSGLAWPSLRKGRGTATAKRPPEEEGGCELGERGICRSLKTVVGDEDAAFDIVGGRGGVPIFVFCIIGVRSVKGGLVAKK